MHLYAYTKYPETSLYVVSKLSGRKQNNKLVI